MTLNFPSNPVDQQEYSGYIYNATKGVWDKAPVSGLPNQAANSGKYLTTDGSSASWSTITTDPSEDLIKSNAFFGDRSVTVSNSTAENSFQSQEPPGLIRIASLSQAYEQPVIFPEIFETSGNSFDDKYLIKIYIVPYSSGFTPIGQVSMFRTVNGAEVTTSNISYYYNNSSSSGNSFGTSVPLFNLNTTDSVGQYISLTMDLNMTSYYGGHSSFYMSGAAVRPETNSVNMLNFAGHIQDSFTSLGFKSSNGKQFNVSMEVYKYV